MRKAVLTSPIARMSSQPGQWTSNHQAFVDSFGGEASPSTPNLGVPAGVGPSTTSFGGPPPFGKYEVGVVVPLVGGDGWGEDGKGAFGEGRGI